MSERWAQVSTTLWSDDEGAGPVYQSSLVPLGPMPVRIEIDGRLVRDDRSTFISIPSGGRMEISAGPAPTDRGRKPYEGMVHSVTCGKLELGTCTCGLDERRMDSSAASTDYVMPWVDVSDRELFEERMRIAKQAVDEWTRARDHYQPMMNAHYGISVLREEFEELWAEIKTKHPDKGRMREEALQVAAMALAFVLEVCDE